MGEDDVIDSDDDYGDVENNDGDEGGERSVKRRLGAMMTMVMTLMIMSMSAACGNNNDEDSNDNDIGDSDSNNDGCATGVGRPAVIDGDDDDDDDDGCATGVGRPAGADGEEMGAKMSVGSRRQP